MSSGQPIPGIKTSEVLTVWRTLHVEVDSMGAEPEGTPFPIDGSDVLRGDVDDPDISALPAAFAAAYIGVKQDTGFDDDQTPWRHSFADDYPALHRYFMGAGGERGAFGGEDYWIAHVAGIYEAGTVVENGQDIADNDPSNEAASAGTTGLGYSVVNMEVLRDFHHQHGFTPEEALNSLRGVTLHEIAHQFLGLGHSNAPDDVMWAPATDADETILKDRPLVFNNADIATIRGVAKP